MIGSCLCGQVQFEISAPITRLYQCHCQLCRKQSGTSSNAATFVPIASLKWLRGEQAITRYNKDTGFTSHFCTVCGSPVPNRLREYDTYWVPAGLLENIADARIVADICLNSRAAWDSYRDSPNPHETMPDFAAMHEMLRTG